MHYIVLHIIFYMYLIALTLSLTNRSVITLFVNNIQNIKEENIFAKKYIKHEIFDLVKFFYPAVKCGSFLSNLLNNCNLMIEILKRSYFHRNKKNIYTR